MLGSLTENEVDNTTNKLSQSTSNVVHIENNIVLCYTPSIPFARNMFHLDPAILSGVRAKRRTAHRFLLAGETDEIWPTARLLLSNNFQNTSI